MRERESVQTMNELVMNYKGTGLEERALCGHKLQMGSMGHQTEAAVCLHHTHKMMDRNTQDDCAHAGS